MQTHAARIRVISCLILTAAFTTVAGRTASAAHEDEDPAVWRDITTAELTPDGRWLVYEMRPTPLVTSPSAGHVTVVVRSTETETERRFDAGPAASGGGGVQLSRSGQWLAFTRSVAEPEKRSTVAVEVASGREVLLAPAERAWFAGANAEFLVLETMSDAPDPKLSVRIHHLETGRSTLLRDIRGLAINPTNTHLAFVTGGGLHVRDLSLERTRVIDQAIGAGDVQMIWAPSGKALAVLTANAGPDSTVLVYKGATGSGTRKQPFLARALAGLPEGHEFSRDNPVRPEWRRPDATPLIWREDEQGLYFGISPRLPDRPLVKRDEPQIALWHWRDARLPAQRKAESEQRVTDLCFLSLRDGRFVRLADRNLPSVAPQLRGNYVLGFSTSAYGWNNPPADHKASQIRDYFLVDLHTGRRTPLVKALPVVTRSGLSVIPQLSPDGRFFLYQNKDGDYVSQTIPGSTQRNLTRHLPTKFYFEENAPATRQQPRRTFVDAFQGWSDDGSTVLISDYYDVWALALDGTAAKNLTGNGRRSEIRYAVSSQEGAQPLYFSVDDWKNGRTGLAIGTSNDGGIQILYLENAQRTCIRARSAATRACQIVSSEVPPDIFLVDEEWRQTKRLTDANPAERTRLRSPGAQHLIFKTAHGDVLPASLHLPVGYEAGKSYPTIVMIYEEGETFTNTYIPTSDRYVGRWLRKGYAVLKADVRPRFGEAGDAALEAVTAAVEAGIATGIVDRDRLGLTGHSHGGYETYFIVTQTDLFRAAVPDAGTTDLLSFYGGTRSGLPASVLSESHQPYMRGPWWEHWADYVKGSPLFHASRIQTPLLMIHGDQDEAVPFTQAEELFNTLRRMGNKPVVLLQYVGEGHTLSDAAQRDADRRMEEFFDHFLKDAAAPNWWSDGISE
jgi:dipeptidyl aminopeptidase/acylaminoacyl peptidase